MSRLTYLRVAGNHITVVPRLRDWDDHNVAKHIAYHRKALSMANCPFDVTVDASDVPFSALFHVPFFRELCHVVRTDFKKKLRVCTIENAPSVVVALYNTLVLAGCVGTDTLSKVVFVTTTCP